MNEENEMLKQYLGEKVKILVDGMDGKLLVYSGEILEESATHFKFRDKFNKEFLFSKARLQEVSFLFDGGRKQ